MRKVQREFLAAQAGSGGAARLRFLAELHKEQRLRRISRKGAEVRKEEVLNYYSLHCFKGAARLRFLARPNGSSGRAELHKEQRRRRISREGAEVRKGAKNNFKLLERVWPLRALRA